MTSYYYALWVPCYKEGTPNVKKQTLDKVDLKDKVDDPPLLVRGEINRDTLLISLGYTHGDADERHLLFHKVAHTETGFLVYKLNLDDTEDDFLCKRLRCSMPKAIYHYVKCFFHEHRFHDSDDDSLLEAYFSPNAINIETSEGIRPILEVYLQSYINKYAGCIFQCRDTLHRVSDNQKRNIKLGDSVAELKLVIETNNFILDGESLYCDFLINSYPELIKPELLQRIYGLRSELARYDDRLHRLEASISSRSSLKLGRIGIWASVIGGLAGVGFSYILSQRSSSELQECVSGIKNDIQHIELQDSLSHKELLIIKQQEDSTLRLLNKLQLKK